MADDQGQALDNGPSVKCSRHGVFRHAACLGCAQAEAAQLRPASRNEPRIRTHAEDVEVTDLLRTYDRTVARLVELGVDVDARDRANAR